MRHELEENKIEKADTNLNPEIPDNQNKAEILVDQLAEDGVEKEKTYKQCLRVVEKIVEWSEQNGIDITKIKKLGGGFVNLVLLIETADGRGLVAKTFKDQADVATNKSAQSKLNQIAKEDEKFIPQTIAWVDDDTIISEKAEGTPLRKILETADDNNEEEAKAMEAFHNLGSTLAAIHERTEQNVEEVNQGDLAEYRNNSKKFIKHLNLHEDSGLLDLSQSRIINISNKIEKITSGGSVSLIHGDAHLDQFFKAPDESTVTIVDYDSLSWGDPMADVARGLSSIRDWGEKMNTDKEVLKTIENSFMAGYREARTENSNSQESEFDQVKILAYEGRLNMVQLKKFDSLRKKILSLIPSLKKESDLYDNPQFHETKFLKSIELNEKEITDFKELVRIRKNLTKILDYLDSLEI